MNNSIQLRHNRTLFVLLVSVLSIIIAFVLQCIFSPKTYAATISIGGACTLDDAVASLNAISDQSGCTASGAYGTNDTINIPAGTHSYSATANIAVSATIQGAGMGQSIIDMSGAGGDSLGFSKNNSTPASATIQDLSIKNFYSPARAIDVYNFNTVINRVEFYADTNTSTNHIINIQYNHSGFSSTIEDIYIHDITLSTNYHAILIGINGGANSVNNVIRRVTMSDLVLGNAFAISCLSTLGFSNGGGGSIDCLVENSTLYNLNYTVNGGYIAAYSDTASSGDPGNIDVSITARNNTIYTSNPITAPAVGLLAASMAPASYTANATVVSQNNLIIGNVGGVQELNWGLGYVLGVGGTENSQIQSSGGNIVDDTTNLAPLNQPSDQTSVSNLGSTLGPLQDNGGNVPTLALLASSPALDTGVSNSLTTDARGTSRPQGSAFDVGAYELTFNNNNENNNNEVQTSNNTESGGNTLAETGVKYTKLILVISVLLIATTALFWKVSHRSSYVVGK